MPRSDDSHLAKQAETAQLGELPGHLALADPVTDALPEPLVAVPVRNETPAQGNARGVVLSAANPVLLLLPQDPRRRSAVLVAVDNDVYLASSLELAQAAQGSAASTQAFYLPAGVAIPVVNKSALYAAATTTATASRISVLISKDDE